jgi:E-phenylitaconyl-CoA hydratase
MPIRIERRGAVALVVLDRPERLNALDPDHYAALSRAFRELDADEATRAVVVTGAGDRAFSTGADLKAPMPRLGPAAMLSPDPDPLPQRGLDFSKPLIAAINGHCLAGGLCLALAADVRLAAEHATFGLAEVKRGLIAGNGGTVRLARMLPGSLAMEMLLTGDAVDAGTALRSGLVSRILPLAELVPAALDLAARMAANAPLALLAAKEVARRARDMSLADAIRLEQTLLAALHATEDRAEGIAAFAEKRAPRFAGR